MSNGLRPCDRSPPSRELGDPIATRRPTFDVIFSPTGRVLAPVFLALSVLLPTNGLGVDICLMHRLTGLPCPGCGLTRSITSIGHGELSQAAAYHPFGLVIWVLLVSLTLYPLLPRAVRRAVSQAAVRNDDAIRPAYRLFVTTFVGFGLLRFALEVIEKGGVLVS